MEFLDSVKQVGKNWQPYRKWEKEQEDADAQKQELNNKVDIPKEELEKASSYGRTLIDSVNVMDQYSINKAQDVELATKGAIDVPVTFLAFLPLAYKLHKVLGRYLDKNHQVATPAKGLPAVIASWAIPIAIFAGGQAFASIYSKHLQKESSRIARYQSREQALSDPRHFVVYDSDQIEEAKKIAKNIPDPPKEKKRSFLGIGDAIDTIKSLRKDNDNYQKWKENNKKSEEQEKFDWLKTNYSPNQIKDAKYHQNAILGSIKHIEIQSQNYLNNMEMAINSLTKSELLVSAVAGTVLGGVASAVAYLAQKSQSSLKENKIINVLKKPTNTIPAAFGGIYMLGALFAGIFIMPQANKLHKEAAKIGRFKAKQELLSNPRNFITYSDEQMDSVKDVKAKEKPRKGFFKGIFDEIKFLFDAKKDFKDYEEYSKKQKIEEYKLDEALKQVQLKPGQLEQAKALQKKVFKAFEKMDEKAQRYADDTEAAAETVNGSVATVLNEIGLFGTILLGKKFKDRFKSSNKKGKMLWGPLIAAPAVITTAITIFLSTKAVKIKKQAVKIGLMEAMKDLDDPRNFVDNNPPHEKAQQAKQDNPKEKKQTLAGAAKNFFKI